MKAWWCVGVLCWCSVARAQEPAELGADEYGAVATATRTPRPLRSVPASVTVLRREEIEQNAALGSDGLLRSVPSVQTFRRSPSLTADPSSQGLNLRGVGPSAVSRTLVLVDGVPANDPFGGSIYWRALPKLGLDRVEIVPGGGSALYGSAALAGVVQLLSRPVTDSRVEADAMYGSFHTVQLAARGTLHSDRVGASLEGEYLRSDGYRVVAKDQAGPVDKPAGSEHLAVNGRVAVQASKRLAFSSALRLFDEHLDGGTRFTTSDVQSGLLSVDGSYRLRDEASLSLTLFGRLQRFQQSRARFDALRTTEALAGRQDVPADDQGASLVYKSPALRWRGTHIVSAGVDTHRVHGMSRERLSPAQASGSAIVERDAGGQQWLSGAFLQDLYTLHERVEIDVALRADTWRNAHARSDVTLADGSSQDSEFAARNAYALSPRVGARVQVLEMLALRASLYRAFRAPTLNELYRPFQVGTILTESNATLGPELLHGFEGGVELTPLDALVLRVTGFWNRLERPISNVTLATPLADGATRMRANLGHALVRGLEAAIEHRFRRMLTTIASYTLAASEVRDGGATRALVGKRLAQDPVHRASLVLMFDEPKWCSAALQLRASGAQFEDDLNTLRMRAYAVLDLSVSRRLFWKLEFYGAVENLLDSTYLVGRAGVNTVGPPLTARVGLRIRER